jgi:PAS domain S-box-containing protein
MMQKIGYLFMTDGYEISLTEYLDRLTTSHLLLDPQGRIIFANQSSLDFVKMTFDQVDGMHVNDLSIWNDDANARQKLNNAITEAAHGKSDVFEETIRIGQDVTHISIHIEPYPDGKGNIKYIILSANNITRLIKYQKQIELEHSAFYILTKAAAYSSNIYDLCQRLLTDLCLALDFECGTLQLYDKETRILKKGASVGIDQYKEMNVATSIDDPISASANTARSLKPVFAPDAIHHEVYKTHKKRLDEYNCHAFISWPILERGEELIGVLQLFHHKPKDITQYSLKFFSTITDMLASVLKRKMAEETLKESELRYAYLLENATDSIIIAKHGAITFANKAAETLLGYTPEELKHMNWLDIVDLPYREESLKRHLNRKKGIITQKSNEIGLITKNKLTVPVEINVTGNKDYKHSTEYIVIIRDISERKKAEKNKKTLEARMIQAQKMEAIGTLASGISHDFNNILFPIMGYAEITLKLLPENSPAKKNLQEILNAGNRAKDLVKQILAFSRQEKHEKKQIQISPIVKEAVKFIKSTFPSTINVSLDISNNLGTIQADPVQIHQVIMNLCTNAFHAMEKKGGILSIALKRIEFGPDDLGSRPGLKAGSYNQLSVCDNGCGIEPHVLERIFEPYFTTKEKDKGTGLGLPITHGIVKNHGGNISVYSEPGKGTSFHVYLPVIDSYSNEIETTSSITLPAGNEHILLVDDQIHILKLMEQMLEGLGYTISFRTGSIDALEAFKANPDQYDLVITDYTMPNMTGIDLAEALLNIRPDIPVILCTGFSEQFSNQTTGSSKITDILMKPVALKDLSQTVRNALSIKKKPTNS